MTADVRSLYQALILDHCRHPRNFRALAVGCHAEGFNPLCGDRVTVYVRLEHDVIAEATFQGSGCAIATASASLMTESVGGKTVADAEALWGRLHRAITAPPDAACEDLGPLSALAGVREFPVRVKCATLAWRALRAAVEGRGDVVSTESDF